MNMFLTRFKIGLILAFIIMFSYQNKTNAKTNNEAACSARLQIKIINEFVEVTAVCQTSQDTNDLRYELDMLKRSSSGNSKNVQKGKFNTKATEKTVLSHQKMNYSEKDDIQLALKILKNNEIIAEDVVTADDFKTRNMQE